MSNRFVPFLAAAALCLSLAGARPVLAQETVPFVVQRNASLLSAPADTAALVAPLALQDTVQVPVPPAMTDGYVRVTARGGAEGWVEASVLQAPLREQFAPAFATAAVTLSPLAGYQAPQQPVVQGFRDGVNWMLRQSLVYRIRTSGSLITVPDGFVTDFASVPGYLQSFIRSTGTYSSAAVVHDYLYWVQSCTKAQADKLFLLAMEESGVPFANRWSLYLAVRFAGNAAWDGNRSARAQGHLRIVPRPHNSVPGAETWAAYRARLARSGVREAPAPPVPPAACAHGN